MDEDNMSWKIRYMAVYKDYLAAASIGLIVLAAYKVMVHYAYIRNYYGFEYMGQDTDSIKNLVGDPYYYLEIVTVVFMAPLLVFIIDKVGLDDAFARPWIIYNSDANYWANFLKFIDPKLTVLFQALYGLMFCFFSDALENPNIALKMMIEITSVVSIAFVFMRSVHSRIYDVKVLIPPRLNINQ